MHPILSTSSVRFRQALVILAVLAVSGCGSPEDRAQKSYERGMSLVEQKDDVKARLEFRSAVQAKSDMLPAWRALAQLEERAGNVPSAGTAYRRIAELDPKEVDARLRVARLALVSGALDEALRWVSGAVEIDERNADALALRAAVLLRLKDSAGAIQEARKALAVDPGNVDAMIVLAAQNLENNDAKAALQILDGIQGDRANEFGVVIVKIRAFEQLKDLQQVEALLLKLVENNPKQNVFKRELIKFYLAQKRPNDAEKEMRAVVAASPTDTGLGLELVRLILAAKGAAAARAELVDRIKVGGRVLPYQIALAQLDVAQGNVADGTQLLERLANSAASPEDTRDARIALAEIHLSRKNFAAAEPLVSEILKADGRNIPGLRMRSFLRLERGQLDDAIADLRQALNDQPRSVELLSALAVAYERQGAIELADKAYADALKASGYAPGVGLGYVAFMQRRGLGQHVENVLLDVASRNPGNIQILSALAQVKIARQDWVGVQEITETLRKLGNRGGVADQIQAASLSRQQKYDETAGVLENIHNANPEALGPVVALVRTYLRAQKFDEAEDFVKSMLKVNSANADAHVLMGLIQIAKKAPAQAEKSFATAIERQPKNVAGYRALADLHARGGNTDAALKVVQAGLREQPNSFPLRLTLASMLEVKRDYEAAISEYEALLKDAPGALIVANNLASLLSDHRADPASLDRAFALATSLAKSPLPQFKDTLGWIHYRRGNYKTAVPLLEDAAAQLGNLPLVRYHLGMSYKAVGDSDKASEQLRKALDLSQSDAELKGKIATALADLPKKN